MNQNRAISLRDRALDILTGAKSIPALNQSPARTTGSHEDLALALRITLQDLLARFLDGYGQVNYAALKASPSYADFHKMAAALQTFDPASLLNHEARLAFWINLYNTLILDAVISLNVERSVAERLAGVGFFRNAAYIVAGRHVSADDIEHGILRLNRGHPYFLLPQFCSEDPRLGWVIEPFEPRIHFALNCASRSCPPIRAYLPEKIEGQLDLATRSFIAEDIELLPHRMELRISSIFKWFASDFGGRRGTLNFLLAHLSDEGKKDWLACQRERVKFSYKPYDWGLNGKV